MLQKLLRTVNYLYNGIYKLLLMLPLFLPSRKTK